MKSIELVGALQRLVSMQCLPETVPLPSHLERKDLQLFISMMEGSMRCSASRTSFFPTATISFSATLTPPAPSTYASGASPITLPATSPTVVFLFHLSVACRGCECTGRLLLNQNTIPEHRVRPRRPRRKGIDVPDRKDRHKAQKFRCS